MQLSHLCSLPSIILCSFTSGLSTPPPPPPITGGRVLVLSKASSHCCEGLRSTRHNVPGNVRHHWVVGFHFVGNVAQEIPLIMQSLNFTGSMIWVVCDWGTNRAHTRTRWLHSFVISRLRLSTGKKRAEKLNSQDILRVNASFWLINLHL